MNASSGREALFGSKLEELAFISGYDVSGKKHVEAFHRIPHRYVPVAAPISALAHILPQRRR